jgi:alpha-L-fucosidase
MILNISPKADGTIPKEQKDILHAMGSWLKKYGEAVYETRAWEKYGEGPTKMGADHGIMGEPIEGTAKDIRYTRSKDSKTLYAILLDWNEDEDEVILNTLSSDRIDLKNLKSVELINGKKGTYLPLAYKQNAEGLIITLPEHTFEEMAYVLKLNFTGKINPLDKYAILNSVPSYHIVPGDNLGSLVLGADLRLTGNRKDLSNQWKLVSTGKGIYKILNRKNNQKIFECSIEDQNLRITDFKGNDHQLWKIEDANNGLLRILNKQFPEQMLSVNTPSEEGKSAELPDPESNLSSRWKLMEVCETEQKAFKPHNIPGIIEAEDFDIGCPGDAYFDSDKINEGRQYRPDEYVDIEKCSAGGYNVGWTRTGDWMSYTTTINKTATYQISFYIASDYKTGKLHIECDGEDKTGIITIPYTSGFQSWKVIKQNIKLDAGRHVLKLVIDGDFLNIDKMIFEEVKY